MQDSAIFGCGGVRWLKNYLKYFYLYILYIAKHAFLYNNNNNNRKLIIIIIILIKKKIDSDKYTKVFDIWIIDRGIKIDESSHK